MIRVTIPAVNARQRESLERTRKALALVIEDRIAFLADFLQRIEIADGESVGRNAARFVPDISAWLDAQTIEPDDVGFILLRVAILIGEVLAQELGGIWFLEENPASPDFNNYVIGRFTRDGIPNRSLNPFRAARDYIEGTREHGPAGVPTRGVTSIVVADGRVTRTLIGVIADLRAEANTPLRVELDYAGSKAESLPGRGSSDRPPWAILAVIIAIGMAMILYTIWKISLTLQDTMP